MEPPVLIAAIFFLLGGVYLGGISSLTSILSNQFESETLEEELQESHLISVEDWSKYEERFPYHMSSFTKDGSPILYVPIGTWNMSEEIQSEDGKLFRYVSDKLLGFIYFKSVSMGLPTETSTSFVVIINLKGCRKEEDVDHYSNCLELSSEIMGTMASKYISKLGKLIFINGAPMLVQGFADGMRLRRNKQGGRSQNAVHLLGDVDSWRPILLQYIAKEEMPKDLQQQLEELS